MSTMQPAIPEVRKVASMKRGIVVGGDVGVARATARTALGPRLSVKTALNDSIRMAFVVRRVDQEVKQKTFHQQFSGAYGTRRKKR